MGYVLYLHEVGFRPLAGVNYNIPTVLPNWTWLYCFRPLAGVNYNQTRRTYGKVLCCFRPLAGVNYNVAPSVVAVIGFCFRPLAGVNYNTPEESTWTATPTRFRPLAGVNYNRGGGQWTDLHAAFPSPCGGEL